MSRTAAVLTSLCLLGVSPGAALAESDHQEFGATLYVPFKASAAGTSSVTATDARSFTLTFEYPQAPPGQEASWRVELIAPDGLLVQTWRGVARLAPNPVNVWIRWGGRRDGAGLPDGLYMVRMSAAAQPADSALAGAGSVDAALVAAGEDAIEQRWEFQVGAPLAASSASSATPLSGAIDTPALPYKAYLGNLHSQTNHSDGGGALGSCKGAQAPQSAAFGPADAYDYARKRGLDLLVTSEHNHMYDGSDGLDANANPDKARALYQSGLTAAADFSAANPGFLAVYGLEWGVINNGGHLNIFNSPELLEWETNAAGQLIGDTVTPKNDYAGLYTLMRQRGWIGQFNHPALGGQFKVDGVALGYHPDGDQVMALCEVLNTSAFSTNTTESEKGRSNFEMACNKALEAGYHVAFSSNQDNHCANWGASSTNRTGLLVPADTPLNQASFLEALRSRRVFATMDKTSQLVLTANGHIMGERFASSGPLTLNAYHTSTSGKRAALVQLMEGVPGRNGNVSVLATTASATVRPAPGEHFYYAKVTQEDGNILWSAPVWVTQGVKSALAKVGHARVALAKGGWNSRR